MSERKAGQSAFTHIRIPVEALLDPRLNHTERILLAYWSAFGKEADGTPKTCWQADETQAAALGMSVRTIQNAMTHLRKLGILVEREFPVNQHVKYQPVWPKATHQKREVGPAKSGVKTSRIQEQRKKEYERGERKIYSPPKDGDATAKTPEGAKPVLGEADVRAVLDGLGFEDSLSEKVSARMDALGWKTPEGRPFRGVRGTERFIEGLAERIERSMPGDGPKTRNARQPEARNLDYSANANDCQFRVVHGGRG